jgi:hypothetical protein
MMLISEWDPPKQLKKQYEKVELVSNGTNPVFLGYLNASGAYLKKIFYYNFKKVGSRDFPMAITEIDYFEGDSAITKTTFDRFEFDHPADAEIVNFRIPANATLE